MRRVFGGVVLVIAGAVGILGVVTGLQLRAPGWQKTVTIVIFLIVAIGLARLGRRLWRRPEGLSQPNR